MTGHLPPSPRWSRITPLAFLLLLVPLRPVCAQAPPARPTLAATLAGAQPPTKGVALAVDADQIKLPPDALLPGTTPTVAETSSAYGRTTQRFGAVTAVAPPTMIILNTAPGEPNIYAGMPETDALPLFAATLSEAQWRALTSEQGLAVADLDTPTQRQLFAALLSHDGKAIVMPHYAAGETGGEDDRLDLTDKLPQAHLRLGQTVGIELPIKDQPNSSYGSTPVPLAPGSPRQYEVTDRFQGFGGMNDTVYGAAVRAEVPNVPKRGQLDFSAAALQAAIPLSGLKTVGDLIYRIGSATRTELYVDKRLESKPLTLLGADAAPAADLLRALAFCLTGTFRQVGPAYVLTDDILGIATRRQIWSDFEHEADLLRLKPVRDATDALSTRHTARDLSWFGDASAFSPEQDKGFSGDSFSELALPLSKLTPAQQDMARRAAEYWNQEVASGRMGSQPLTTDGDIRLKPSLRVQLIVPGIDKPVDMNINAGNLDDSFLLNTPYGVNDAGLAAYQAQAEADAAKRRTQEASVTGKAAPPSAVFAVLRAAPRRAALVHPRTARAVDDDVAAMKTLGMNELWLDVFSDGAAHVPGSPLSPAEPLPPGENDILTEALAKTKGTDIRVFPVLSLLFWGQTPPAQICDLNVLGETSAQAATRWQQQKAMLPEGQGMPDEYTTGGIVPDWPGVAVNPVAPEVRQALIALFGTLAARPGVAGMVWRDTDPPGYDTLPGGADVGSLLLGYQGTMRLAFLRRFHADPLDVYPSGRYVGKANTDLPNFTTQFSDSSHLDDEWVQFRRDANLGLLHALYAAANPPKSTRHLPLLLKQRRRGQGGNDYQGHHIYPPGWYGSWDDPRQPPPTLHSRGEDAEPGKPIQTVPDETAQAASQSRAVLVPITADLLQTFRENFAQSQPYLKSHPMPGFVLDLGAATDGGTDPLVALAKSPSTPMKQATP